jgi:hypothetical protein
MQKVEGSSPFSRFGERPAATALLVCEPLDGVPEHRGGEKRDRVANPLGPHVDGAFGPPGTR